MSTVRPLSDVQRNVLVAVADPGVTWYPGIPGSFRAYVDGDDGRSVGRTVISLAKRGLVEYEAYRPREPRKVLLTARGRATLGLSTGRRGDRGRG